MRWIVEHNHHWCYCTQCCLQCVNVWPCFHWLASEYFILNCRKLCNQWTSQLDQYKFWLVLRFFLRVDHCYWVSPARVIKNQRQNCRPTYWVIGLHVWIAFWYSMEVSLCTQKFILNNAFCVHFVPWNVKCTNHPLLLKIVCGWRSIKSMIDWPTILWVINVKLIPLKTPLKNKIF